MLAGYAEDPFVRPPNRLRRKRISQDDYNYPPPRRAQRPRPRPIPRAPAYYYPEDDYYYDRPRRRPVRDYEEDYPPQPREDRVGSTPRKTPAKSSGGGRAAVAIVVLIFIILLLYMFREPINEFINNPPPLKYQEFPEELEFTVQKIMTLRVTGSGQDSISYTLKSACPKDNVMGDFYLQDVKDVEVQPVPTTGYPDIGERTQEIMLWHEDNFHDEKDFEIIYSIHTRFYQWVFEEEDSGVIGDIPAGLKTKYNHNEWRIDDDHDDILDVDEDIDHDGEWDYRIEVTNPAIQRLASTLAEGDTNVYRVVMKIYDYLTMEENLNYIPSAEGLPKDCITTLNRKQGDCDDYSILFVSLCRAVDIPAWLELGVLYDRQQLRWGGHGWAKVAIPFQGGWTAATIDIVNKQFLFHDPYRFIEWVDTGGDITVTEYGETKQVNNLDYYYHSFSFRSYGSPTIHSPDTNNFVTINMNEIGEKKKVPVEDDGMGSGLCMTPGFEGWVGILALASITFLIAVTRPNRIKKMLRK